MVRFKAYQVVAVKWLTDDWAFEELTQCVSVLGLSLGWLSREVRQPLSHGMDIRVHVCVVITSITLDLVKNPTRGQGK